jgi:hypothetical protein
VLRALYELPQRNWGEEMERLGSEAGEEAGAESLELRSDGVPREVVNIIRD